jgi:hypothetical protein
VERIAEVFGSFGAMDTLEDVEAVHGQLSRDLVLKMRRRL